MEPVLYSVSAFILIMSGIALLRQYRLFNKIELVVTHELKLPGWEGSATTKALSVILAVSILGAIGVLGFTIAKPKVGERFTEYYILGNSGKAQDYPSEFIMDGSQVTRVKYGIEMIETIADRGTVTIGIVNHEYQTTSYLILMVTDGEAVDIFYDREYVSELGPVELADEGKWEQEIGFTPQHVGENQKVEFLLFKKGESDPYLTLHLWIDIVAN